MDMSIHSYLDASVFAGDLDAGQAKCSGHQVMLRDCLVEHYDRLHRRLLHHLGCPDKATECLHDAWLRLGDMTAAATIQCPEAYVYRVACNLAMDRLRSNRHWQYMDDTDSQLEYLADKSPGPDCIAEARSDVEAMVLAVQRLPHRHQAILFALRIDEMTRHEVAATHGISLRQVDTVLRQALDYCSAQTGQAVMAGVRSPRRALPQARMRA
jgi:RNA polymerase sigma factor (sigma-70 family)